MTLERIIDNAKGCLKGQYVEALIGEQGKKACAPGYDFTAVTRSNDTFEALMAYFHIDRTRFYADGLGLSQPLRSKRQKVFVNAIPDDNSFYSSQTQQLVLGTGGVDDGEDADVIVHEYGHSLQDQASPRSLQTREGGDDRRGLRRLHGRRDVRPDDRPEPIRHLHLRLGRDLLLVERAAAATPTVKQNLETAERKCQQGDPLRRPGRLVDAVRAAPGARQRHQRPVDHGPRRPRGELHATRRARPTSRSPRAIVAADQLLYAGAHIPTIEADLVSRKFCKSSGC